MRFPIKTFPGPLILRGLCLGGLYLAFAAAGSIGQESSASVGKEAQIRQETGDGLHAATGLVVGEGLEIVMDNCLGCHSGKLIAQNRASREGWKNLIRWMQKTQKLWDLGSNEDAILDYLEKNYAPIKKGRRAPLNNIQWHSLTK